MGSRSRLSSSGLRFLRPTGDLQLVRATEAAIALLAFVLLTLEVRSVFRHDANDGAGRALHGARVLRPGVGRVRARRPLAGAHARRCRGLVGVARQRRAGRGVGAGRAGAARQSDLRQSRCRPTADRQRPVPGLRAAGGDGGAGAALDRRRAQPQRRFVRRSGRLDPGLRLRVVRGPPPVRSRLRATWTKASGLELYVYSAVWLLFGVALLALGFLRNAAALRHAGMALVCVVVAKVFLVDMAGLQGCCASFRSLASARRWSG